MRENIPIQGIIMIGGTPPTLRDDLMQFFSNDDNALLDYSRVEKQIYNYCSNTCFHRQHSLSTLPQCTGIYLYHHKGRKSLLALAAQAELTPVYFKARRMQIMEGLK